MARRLDGKKKLVPLTSQMTRDLSFYCRDHKIKSESELIRQAIASYIYKDYGEHNIQLSGINSINIKASQIHDMISVLFSYVHMMHLNILAYHAEIDSEELKNSAYKSAELRLDKFLAFFRERLRDDSPFFEKLLHEYVAGEIN